MSFTPASATPFAVRDAISMERLQHWAGAFSLASPDNGWLLVHTQRGDREMDRLVDRLILWNADEVAQTLERGTSLPAGRTVAELGSGDERLAPRAVRWLSAHEIGMIAADEGGVLQAFSIDTETGARRQLTRSRDDVVSFALTEAHVIYFAAVESERSTHVVVTDQSVYSLLDLTRPRQEASHVQLFALSRTGGEARPVAGARMANALTGIWPSPNGRHAIVLGPVRDRNPGWQRYRTLHAWDSYAEPAAEVPAGLLEANRRYLLLDLETLSLQPLLAAPANIGRSSATMPIEAHWLPDSQSVIVSSTFLPEGSHALGAADDVAIAEVDIGTGHARPILTRPNYTFDQTRDPQIRPTLSSVLRVTLSTAPVRLTAAIAGANGSSRVVFERVGQRWHVVRNVDPSRALSVTVTEDQNTPPRLFVADRTGRRAQLFNPNPQLATRSFGRAEVVHIRTGQNTEIEAGLIYPVRYQPGTRYPLVIQTHGFWRSEFLTDGPDGVTSSFAAQPLANAGFFVLQINEAAAVTLDGQEARQVADLYAAASRQLVDGGLVDPALIGLIGWSRTAYHVLGALAFHPELFAAASISDGVQYNYTNALFAMFNAEARDDLSRSAGGLPWSSDLEAWFQRSPLYAIRRRGLAVRVESIGEPLSMLESATVLSQHGIAVEHVYFPYGSHVLQRPSEREASQQGVVDWFRYWLKGERDPDPSKAEQYRRWDRMRVPTSPQ